MFAITLAQIVACAFLDNFAHVGTHQYALRIRRTPPAPPHTQAQSPARQRTAHAGSALPCPSLGRRAPTRGVAARDHATAPAGFRLPPGPAPRAEKARGNRAERVLAFRVANPLHPHFRTCGTQYSRGASQQGMVGVGPHRAAVRVEFSFCHKVCGRSGARRDMSGAHIGRAGAPFAPAGVALEAVPGAVHQRGVLAQGRGYGGEARERFSMAVRSSSSVVQRVFSRFLCLGAAPG